jgi:hypothetical protein
MQLHDMLGRCPGKSALGSVALALGHPTLIHPMPHLLDIEADQLHQGLYRTANWLIYQIRTDFRPAEEFLPAMG